MLRQIQMTSINASLVIYRISVNCYRRRQLFRKFHSKALTHTGRNVPKVKTESLGRICTAHGYCKRVAENIDLVQVNNFNDLTTENIGDYVELNGNVHHKTDNYILLRSKSSFIKCMTKKSDVQEWAQTVPLHSYVKVFGEVVPLVRDNKMTKFKNCVDVMIDRAILISKTKTDKSRIQPTDGELEKCRAESGFLVECLERRTHSSAMISEEMIGQDVNLFGWVVDNNGREVLLQDGYGFFLVVPSENMSFAAPTGKVIFLSGVVESYCGEMDNPLINNAVQIRAISLYDEDMRKENEISEKSQVTTQSSGETDGANNVEQISKEGENTNSLKKTKRHKKKENLSPEDRIRVIPQISPVEGTHTVDYNRYTIRSHNCGEVSQSIVGQTVKLVGWVKFLRQKKFIILMDKYGETQLLIPDEKKHELEGVVKELSLESVVAVEGTVASRPVSQCSSKMQSGMVEVIVSKLEIMNKAKQLPFYVTDKPEKNIRLQYRYLDIRQNQVTRDTLVFRSNIVHKMRKFLVEKVGFVDVETPTLFRKTPGGAQEFVVPTRKKGKYFSLVQSPQQFKQMLMVGAMDKYFQFARCYRDEDRRKDRQPEFTQLDIEMSFCERDGVLSLIEDLLSYIWPSQLGPLETPFPRIQYKDAMSQYGTDKPDLRILWKLNDHTSLIRDIPEGERQRLGSVQNQILRNGDFSCMSVVARKGVDQTYDLFKLIMNESNGRKDLSLKIISAVNAVLDLKQMLNETVAKEIVRQMKLNKDDVIIFGYGLTKTLLEVMGRVRMNASYYMNHFRTDTLQTDRQFSIAWVVDFPLFQEVHGKLESVHHPFTQPHPDDLDLLDSNPCLVRGLHYDLVMNGIEIGGGSIRVHDPEMQTKIIRDILKLDIDSLGHMIKALESGAPAHGGFAMGLDRFITLLCGSLSVSDAIAFPKYTGGREPMSGAPCDIPVEDKMRYHLNEKSASE